MSYDLHKMAERCRDAARRVGPTADQPMSPLQRTLYDAANALVSSNRESTETIDPRTGFTETEARCHEHLMDCMEVFFGELDQQHPDESQKFVDAIHQIQDVLAFRIVRRNFPEGWPVKTSVCDGDLTAIR